jgi:hypothetical protein
VLIDFYYTLNMWDNHFCRLLNDHETNGVRQTEIHTADPIALEGSTVMFVMAAEKLLMYKSPGIVQFHHD